MDAMMKKSLILMMLFSCLKGSAMPPSLPNTTRSACYLNSLTQNLYNLAPITKEILQLKNESGYEYLQSYKKLIEAFQNGSGHKELLKDYTKQMIDVGTTMGLQLTGQSDPSEAFSLISGGDQSDPIVKVFKKYMGFEMASVVYQVADDLTSMSVPNEKAKIETQWNLMVPYPGDKADNQGWVKVSDALDAGFKISINRHADDGERSKVRIPRIYGKCPEILMLWVKVFNSKNEKIQTHFNFAETKKDGVGWTIDLNPYVVAGADGFIDKDTQYSLIGFSAHGGGTGGGHYVAYIKDQYDPERAWYSCNDSTIIPVEEHSVLLAAINNGYLFFYRKTSSEGKSIEEQKKKK